MIRFAAGTVSDVIVIDRIINDSFITNGVVIWEKRAESVVRIDWFY